MLEGLGIGEGLGPVPPRPPLPGFASAIIKDTTTLFNVLD